jgi:hypothetical protein
MTRKPKTKVGKKAVYRGHELFLSSQDAEYYYAIYYGPISVGKAPMDLMLDMRNVAKGEYKGRIPINDPDLEIKQ